MRYEPLRRKVLLELGIVIAVMVVILAIVYLLSSIRDGYVENNQSTKQMLDSIDAEFNMLKAKYLFIQQNSTLYEEVKKKQEAGELSVNRTLVLEKFNQLKLKYGLNNFRLSASPVQEIKDPAYVRKTSAVNSSDVNLDLDTLSDERVYELIYAMQEELSGVCKLTRVSLSREKALDEEVLNAIRQKATYPLIKTAIKFTWFSINPVDTKVGVPNAGR